MQRVTTYETYLNERNKSYIAPLKNYSYEYFLRLQNCDGSEEAIKDIVTKWASGYVEGNPAYIQFQNFVDFLTGSIVEQKTLYQIYDLYVFNTFPWEEQGYAFREGIRSGDLAVISQNALLATMYYTVADGYDDATRDKLIDHVQDFLDQYKSFSDAYPVVRHDGYAICQIKDAHVIMKKEIVHRDYYKKPWFPNGTEWDNEHNESAWVVGYGDTSYNCGQTYDMCLSPKEIKAMVKYYEGQPSITCFDDILVKEAGLEFPSDAAGKKHIMLCQSDFYTEGYEYDDYYIYTPEAVASDSSLSIGRQNIGIAYLEHYGFLWMKQKFSWWTSSFDQNRWWFRPSVTSRY